MTDHVDLGDLDDPIGEASIRLLAAGVPGPERLAAVMFLGVLHDHAQPDGRLRVDPFDLAAEFGVAPAEAVRFLGRLTDAAAVGRFGDTWWVSRHEPLHASAVPHALGLSMLRDPSAPSIPLAEPRRMTRSSLPAAIAAVAMVVIGIAGVLRTSAPVASTGVDTVAASSPADIAAPIGSAPAGAEAAVAATTSSPASAAARVAPPQGAGSIAATADCPALPAPVVLIAGVDGVPAIVHGSLRNDQARAVMIHAVDLLLGDSGLVAPALATPVRVEPGSVLSFDVGLPPGASAEGLTAAVRDFSYDAC